MKIKPVSDVESRLTSKLNAIIPNQIKIYFYVNKASLKGDKGHTGATEFNLLCHFYGSCSF